MFREFLRPNSRPHTLGQEEDANLVGMRLYGAGPFHRELKPALRIAKKTHFVVRSGDVIYNKLFAWKGTFGIVPSELDGMFVSDKFPTYELDRSRVDERFLSWYFRWPPLWEEARMMSTGSAALSKLTLNPPKFLLLRMSLPSLAEQRRVVAWIEDLAAQIHEARALRRQAIEEVDALRASLLRSVIQDCHADEIELADACEAIIDNLHSNPRYVPSGIPCIRSPDVGWGDLNLDVAFQTDEAEYLRRTARGEPKAGDIVFVREGGGTGKCALVLPGQRFSLGQRVMMLRPNEGKVLPRFLLYQLLSPLMQDDQIDRLSKGSASPHLNIGALRRFRFRLPALSEQQRIVAALDALQVKIDALEQLQAETAASFDALLPAVLDYAFQGAL